MGGGIDKQGNVDSVKLIQIVKEEFNMTIDIERLLNEIDTDKSGLISYMEFKTLLSNWLLCLLYNIYFIKDIFYEYIKWSRGGRAIFIILFKKKILIIFIFFFELK